MPLQKSVISFTGYLLGNVLIDKPSGRELGLKAMAKDILEFTLVVIESKFFSVVDRSNIDHNVTSVELCGIPTANDV